MKPGREVSVKFCTKEKKSPRDEEKEKTGSEQNLPRGAARERTAGVKHELMSVGTDGQKHRNLQLCLFVYLFVLIVCKQDVLKNFSKWESSVCPLNSNRKTQKEDEDF